MQSYPRGRAIIVVNEYVAGEFEPRKGTQKDAENLDKSLRQLHFKVVRWNNLTAKVC